MPTDAKAALDSLNAQREGIVEEISNTAFVIDRDPVNRKAISDLRQKVTDLEPKEPNFTEDELKKLTDAEQAVKALDADVEAVIKQINALPDTADVKFDSKADIEKVAAAIDKLEKDYNSNILTSAEKQRYSDAKKALDDLNTKRSEIVEKIANSNFTIDLTNASQDAITAMRQEVTDFEPYGPNFTEEELKKLTDAEKAMTELKSKSKALHKQISELPAGDKVDKYKTYSNLIDQIEKDFSELQQKGDSPSAEETGKIQSVKDALAAIEKTRDDLVKDMGAASDAAKVKYIGDQALAYNSNLTEIVFSKNLVTIGKRTFAYDSGLTSITLPEKLESIPDEAFSTCGNLKEINFNQNLKSIGIDAFEYCDSLVDVVLPEGLQSIANYAFEQCDNLKSVLIPDSVTSMGQFVFDKCYNLQSVKLSKGLKTIPRLTFEQCDLRSVIIPDGVTSIEEGAFSQCGKLAKVKIPGSVKTIGKGAFFNTFSLKEVRIPEGVEVIEYGAFAGCHVESLILPVSIKTIGKKAFIYGYPSEKNVYYQGSESDRAKISIDSTNFDEGFLASATWHYMSSGPDRTQKPSSGVTSPVSVSNPTNSSDVRLYVRGSNGSMISNATVLVDGQEVDKTKSGYIDLPCPEDNRLTLTVSADTYYTLDTVKIVEPGSSTMVTLKKMSDYDIACTSVWVQGKSDRYEVLTEELILYADKENEDYFAFYPNIECSGSGEPPKTLRLVQADGKVLFDYEIKQDETPAFSVKLRKEADPGQELSIVAYDTDGFEVVRVPLKIAIRKPMALGGFTFGSTTSIKVSDSVPILGGQNLTLDLKMSTPVKVELSDDFNKLKIYFGNTEQILKDKIGKNDVDGKPLGEGEKLEDYIRNKYDSFEDLDSATATKVLNTAATFEIAGYGEGTVNNYNDRVVFHANAYILLKVSGGATYYLPIAIPCYVKMNLSGGLSADGDAVLEVGDGRILSSKLSSNFHLMPSVTLGAGVGIDGVTNVSVNGTGGFDVGYTIPSNKLDVNMTLSADIRIKPPLLKEWVYPIAKNTWNLYSWQGTAFNALNTENSEWSEAVAAMYDASNYTTMERTYVHDVSPQANVPGQVQAGVYPFAKPELIEYGGKLYLFYLDDASERDDANSTVLCYRMATESGWSDPIRVQDDATADDGFALFAADDGVYAVWQNAKKQFDAATDDWQSIQESIGLTVAKVTASGVEKTWTVDTTEEMTPFMPSLAVNNGSVTVVWTENDTNALDGSGTNTIFAQKLDGARVTCATRTNPIMTLQAGTLDGKFSVAWTEDMDGDKSTLSDREVWLYQDGEVTRLTENDTLDSNPQFAALNGGELIWYSNNNFVELKALGEEPAAILPENSGNYSDTFNVSASNGRAVLLIGESYTLDETAKQNLYTVSYDGTAWAQPEVCLMTDKEIAGMDVLCTATGENKLTYAVTQDNQTELYADNIQYVGIAKIKELEMSENDYVTKNTDFPVKMTVINAGQGSGTVQVRFVSSANDAVSWSQDFGTLAAGESQELTLQKVRLAAGDYTMQVLTDGTVTDSREVSLGNTDLSVVANTYYSNGEELADIQIRNLSNIVSGSTFTITPSNDPENVLYKASPTLSKHGAQSYIVNLTQLFQDAGDAKSLTVQVTAKKNETRLATNTLVLYNPDRKTDDITTVTLNKTEMSLHRGASSKLTAETTGSAAELTWTSTNPDVAKVDENGRVTAVAAGMATITCQYGDAYATCVVTVTDGETDAITSDSYTIDEDAGTLTGFAPGTTPAQIRATLNDQSVTFEKVNGEEAPEDKPIGTGCTVTNGNQTLTLLLYGDVNGDGSITMLDMVAVRKHIMKVKLLEGIYLRAAAPSKPEAENPNPSMLDMVRVRKYIMHVSDSVL